MPSRYCDDPNCGDPDCRDLREWGAKQDAKYLARRSYCKPGCDSLVPSMSTNPCDCGKAANGV